MSSVLSAVVDFVKSRPLSSLAVAGAFLVLFRMEIFGAERVEQPKFQLVYSPPGVDPSSSEYFEIRRYAPQIRATTTFMVPRGSRRGRDGGFMTIARYIFGSNRASSGAKEEIAMTAPVLMEQSQKTAPVLTEPKSERIAMTAPVLMQGMVPEDGGSGEPEEVEMTMSFVMPSKYTSLSQLPTPLDSRVKLTEIPEHTVAVLRRSGSLTVALSVSMEKELRSLVAKDGKYKLAETGATTAGYNPPW
ncbi:regulatory factor, effector binding domain-containing protein [Hyaloraphidium curvatum]|nr:regulatory factor, effector binding domain-containing protein [Hyaloraphidium curvatum]